MDKYAGKRGVITGGSTGIGFATAKLLIDGGAKVVFTARSADAVAKAAAELGPNAIGIVSDTSRLADLDALASKVRSSLGGIDFLFVNAGIAKFLPFTDVTEAFYDDLFAVNTKGAFFAVQKLSSLLQKGGAVVLNTSVVDEKGMPTTSVYAATKAALRSLTRTLAAELLPQGVRVNAVSPGPIETPIYGKLGMPQEAVDAFATQMRDGNPSKRFGAAQEVARAALFLAFEATYSVGIELPVDGGLTQL